MQTIGIYKFIIRKIIVLDFTCRLLYINTIRGIRKNEVCLLTVHKTGIHFLASAVSTNDSVLPYQPQISFFGENRLLKFGIDIEVVFLDFLAVQLIEKLVDLRRLKARLAEVEVAVTDILQ